MLKAAHKEAGDAGWARDMAEAKARDQGECLRSLKEREASLESSLSEGRRGRRALLARAEGLQQELEGRLSHIHTLEDKLAEERDLNARLREEIRLAKGSLRVSATARQALLDFCQQERTSVEREASEHVARAQEGAAMAAEDGLGQGLELARLAEAGHQAQVEALREEVDRLARALLSSRAEMSVKEEQVLALKRELAKAAMAIAGLKHTLEGSCQQGATTWQGPCAEGRQSDVSGSAVTEKASGSPFPALRSATKDEEDSFCSGRTVKVMPEGNGAGVTGAGAGAGSGGAPQGSPTEVGIVEGDSAMRRVG
ncbi:unnamed protein product [Discosporangium mesarthrocarpum]